MQAKSRLHCATPKVGRKSGLAVRNGFTVVATSLASLSFFRRPCGSGLWPHVERPLSQTGPEFVDFGDLSGPMAPPQNQPKTVGGEKLLVFLAGLWGPIGHVLATQIVDLCPGLGFLNIGLSRLTAAAWRLYAHLGGKPQSGKGVGTIGGVGG